MFTPKSTFMYACLPLSTSMCSQVYVCVCMCICLCLQLHVCVAISTVTGMLADVPLDMSDCRAICRADDRNIYTPLHISNYLSAHRSICLLWVDALSRLCCVVRRSAALRCVVSCRVVLWCVVGCGVACCVVLCRVVLRCVVLCGAVLCRAGLWDALLCCACFACALGRRMVEPASAFAEV